MPSAQGSFQNRRMHSPEPFAHHRQAPAFASGLPAQLFDSTPEQRLARARRQFFEQGLRPTGTVPEAVIQSWARCLQQRQNPARVPQFEPVTMSRVHSVLGRNRQLLEAAGGELAQLARTLAGTPVTGLLLDPAGVVMHVTPRQARPDEQILPRSARVGVCLAEERIGTNAPALTAITGQATVVRGGEHFADAAGRMHCAAAPVRDHQGRLVAVLDLSVEGHPFGFDAPMLAGLSATAIENQLLRATSPVPLVLRLHCNAAMLDTALAGLLGVDEDGRVAWLNAAAMRLLGLEQLWPLPESAHIETWLGRPLAALLGMAWTQTTQRLHLPSGLALWARCAVHRQTVVEAPTPEPAPSRDDALPAAPPTDRATRPQAAGRPGPAANPAPLAGATLRDREHDLVLRVLDDCQGNVSMAARRLGVSRGLIYRQLKRSLQG